MHGISYIAFVFSFVYLELHWHSWLGQYALLICYPQRNVIYVMDIMCCFSAKITALLDIGYINVY